MQSVALIRCYPSCHALPCLRARSPPYFYNFSLPLSYDYSVLLQYGFFPDPGDGILFDAGDTGGAGEKKEKIIEYGGDDDDVLAQREDPQYSAAVGKVTGGMCSLLLV